MRNLLVTLVVSLTLISAIYYLTRKPSSVSQNVTEVVEKLADPLTPSKLSIDYLSNLNFDSPAPTIERELTSGSNYKRYIASYFSDGYKINGLLTVPNSPPPEGGYSGIVFVHGYIPPDQYVTTEKYIAYVDSLARNNFVVFKIDLRGHGDSEGEPTGSYFSSGYSIDIANAVSSLGKYANVNPNKIGTWGHSMAGNATFRTLLITDKVKAAVIWGGAVYSYEDFFNYGISDNSYSRSPRTPRQNPDLTEKEQAEIQSIRDRKTKPDFTDDFWQSISLTQNLDKLATPVQLNHSKDDDVVNVGYSIDLAKALDEAGKVNELYTYNGGGHNIESPYFEQAMENTIRFYKEKLQ